MPQTSPFIVSPQWLAERLGDPAIRIVDAAWYLPDQKRDAKAEYATAHIPGAVFFDHDAVVEPGVPLPHALPSPKVFAEHAGRLGITETDTIVVHDGPGFFSAPRLWWLLRAMGAEKVFVLDGGFDGWKQAGLPVTDAPTVIAPVRFTPRFNENAVVRFDEMRRIVETGDAQVADARSAGRFAAREPEPRPGMRSGHMPGAFNVHYASLSREGRLKDFESLRETLLASGLDLSRPVVTSCGSGITAAVISLALQSVGHTDNRLYDGSWTEWGGRADTPVETGDAKDR